MTLESVRDKKHRQSEDMLHAYPVFATSMLGKDTKEYASQATYYLLLYEKSNNIKQLQHWEAKSKTSKYLEI